MKTFAIALMASSVDAAFRNCLYCKKTDQGATFMTSYSYCAELEECLANAWNYLDRPCQGGWNRGKSLTIDSCEAEEASRECPSFTSTKELRGQTQSTTWSLQSGTYCDVNIDAEQFVGRATFDDVTHLGIEVEGDVQSIGEPISFQGTKYGSIRLYNAAQSGTVTFTITFSGASTLLLSAVALISLPALSTF